MPPAETWVSQLCHRRHEAGGQAGVASPFCICILTFHIKVLAERDSVGEKIENNCSKVFPMQIKKYIYPQRYF